jgi:hypothetical protein
MTRKKKNANEAGKPSAIRLLFLAVVALMLFMASACDTTSTSPGTGTQTDPLAPGQYGGQYSGGTATGDTEAGARFAQWVIDQDPQHQIITDAVVREEQTLGVKVQPNATKGDVQNLLVALTQGMSNTFPGKPLKVIAFYQSGDKLAEANYAGGNSQVEVEFAP